jgi:hypothetical protein
MHVVQSGQAVARIQTSNGPQCLIHRQLARQAGSWRAGLDHSRCNLSNAAPWQTRAWRGGGLVQPPFPLSHWCWFHPNWECHSSHDVFSAGSPYFECGQLPGGFFQGARGNLLVCLQNLVLTASLYRENLDYVQQIAKRYKVVCWEQAICRTVVIQLAVAFYCIIGQSCTYLCWDNDNCSANCCRTSAGTCTTLFSSLGTTIVHTVIALLLCSKICCFFFAAVPSELYRFQCRIFTQEYLQVGGLGLLFWNSPCKALSSSQFCCKDTAKPCTTIHPGCRVIHVCRLAELNLPSIVAIVLWHAPSDID